VNRRRWVSIALWSAAFVLAVALGFLQRMTGPSYPVEGRFISGGETVGYSLPRSHGGAGGLTIDLRLPSPDHEATIMWRRYPTEDAWQALPMLRISDGVVSAEIPHQPPAGKVEYWIRVSGGGTELRIPSSESVVARYRGSVRASILIPHIIAMFASLMVASRALFEVLRPSYGSSPSGAAKGTILVSMGLLGVGGLILGPLVQLEAFGALWTGWPFGTDLTDNKTLIAVLAWLPAVVAALRSKKTRLAVVAGWIVMMAVFSIPHSMRGSQLDWDAESPQTTSSRKP
jgi:hypothetical protein